MSRSHATNQTMINPRNISWSCYMNKFTELLYRNVAVVQLLWVTEYRDMSNSQPTVSVLITVL